MAIALPEFVQMVRKFMCDFPRSNELRGVAESTDQEIMMSAMLALDDYNTTPPPIRAVSWNEHPSTHLLLLGTICHLFLSKGILHLRNHLSYNDGGIAVNVWDKGPAYIGNAQYIGQLWEQKKNALKRTINISNGFGVVQSAEFNIYNFTAFFGGDYVVTATGSTLGGLPVPTSRHGSGGALPDPSQAKTRTSVINFTFNDWRQSIADPSLYEFIFVHNLMYRNVDIILNDDQNKDITDGVDITRASDNYLIIQVTEPNRFAGNIQAFIPG